MEIKEQAKKTSIFYWIYLVGFFLIASLPLWAAPPLLHPAPWGKTIIFRIALSILIFIFVYQVSYKKDGSLVKKTRTKPIKLILGILTILGSLFLLSNVFSQDIGFSFWGNPLRGGGFLNFAFYIILSIFAFLTIKGRDWNKIWNFSIFVGALSVIFGIFQYFSLFSAFIVSSDSGVASTMGNSSQFAIYLSLLFFITLSFLLKETSILKKTLYSLSLALFIFGVFITGARATYLSILIGLLFFFFFYPKKLPKLKIAVGCFLFLSILGVYLLNNFPNPPDLVKNAPILNRTFSYLVARTSLKTALFDLTETRFSAWKVGIQAIKEKPIFGWGPENFSIGFDKYYDPTLPQITSLWWDRAHNFLIEYASTSGVPFLFTYLLLIGVLFWQLQRVKKSQNPGEIDTNNRVIIAHAIQSAFIAYLINIFFTFDSVDTYLFFFLIVGYCLYLISLSQKELLLNQNNNASRFISSLHRWRKIVISFLFFLLIIFIWWGNLKPLLINAEINWSEYYSEKGQCQKSIDRIEKISLSRSIISHYVMLQYSDVIKRCQIDNPRQQAVFIEKSIQILEEASKLRPTYTRTWLLLGSYMNLSVINNSGMKIEDKEILLQKAEYYFQKAIKLSPYRQEILAGWSDTYLLWGKYDQAKEKAEQCIKINGKFGGCYWQKALADIVSGQIIEGKENLEKARQNQFQIESQENHLSQLLNAYLTLIKNTKNINLKYYRGLADVYEKLTYVDMENFQYHASLAYVYRLLGEYRKAREEAMLVIKFSPESKQNVEEFLKTLPY